MYFEDEESELQIGSEQQLREEAVAMIKSTGEQTATKKERPKRLTLQSSRSFKKASSVDLATIIGSTPFECIDLGDVKLEGSMDVLLNAVARSVELRKFRWTACSNGSLGPWPVVGDMVLLGEALGKLCKLKQLCIGFQGKDPFVLRATRAVDDQRILGSIRPLALVLPLLRRPNHHAISDVSFCSGSFRVLPDKNGSVEFQYLCQFFNACQTSVTLQHLDLTFGYNFEGFPAPAVGMAGQLIRQSQSLKTFRIRFVKVESMQELAEALRYNQSLEELRIEVGVTWSHFPDVYAPIDLFSKEETSALHETLRYHNFIIQKLEILPWMAWKSRPVDPWRAVRCLEHFEKFSDEIQTDLASIYFFLHLNGSRDSYTTSTARYPLQRGWFLWPRALPGVGQDKWIDLIAHHAYDNSALFYYLRTQLSLFHCKNVKSPHNQNGLKRRHDQVESQPKKRKVANSGSPRRSESTSRGGSLFFEVDSSSWGSSGWSSNVIKDRLLRLEADAKTLTQDERIDVATSMRHAAARIEMHDIARRE